MICSQIAALEKKLINIQHAKFGAITAVLILTTVMLIPSDLSQNSVFAQSSTSTLDNTPITPTSESSGSVDGSSNENSDNSNGESSSSPGSAVDDINPQDDTSLGEEEDSDSLDDTSSSEEEAEDDFEQTNPLLEQIRNNVNGALSASGIAVK